MRKQEHVSCSCGMCRRGRRTAWGKQALRRGNRLIRYHYNAVLRDVARGADPDIDYFVVSTEYTD